MRNKLYFKNKRGFNLCGDILLPENKNNIPFVVMCHGFTSSKECNTFIALREKLFKLGIGSFAFDLMGHGESEGNFNEITVSKCVEDLETAFEYIQRYDCIDFSNIGLFGRSFGGKIALWYVVNHNNVKILGLNAPCSDCAKTPILDIDEKVIQEWQNAGSINGLFGSKDVRMNYEFYDDIVSHNTYEMVKNLSLNCLIVHGDADTTVPVEQSVKLKETIGDNATLKIIEGAGHRFDLPGQFEKSIDSTIEFFKENLM